MSHLYKTTFAISALFVIASIVLIATFGLPLGIDFTGGAVSEIMIDQAQPSIEDMRQTVETLDFVTDAHIAPTSDQTYIIRTNTLSEQEHQAMLTTLQVYGTVTELRFDSIGPVIGNELRSKSITAIVVLLIVIVLYIAMVFRSMAEVLSPWAMGVAAIVALAHDVLIPLGVFALLGHLAGIEVSAVFIAAVLTILGYSVADTVVVFDRVRENVLLKGKKMPFNDIVHISIKQTITRSINTSLTTLFALVAIYLFGGASLQYFALALIIGIALGTYSSIFVATPILMFWERRRDRK